VISLLKRVAPLQWFIWARGVSLLGSSMAPAALSLSVLAYTGSATDLGIVLAANTIPLIFLTLFGGVLGDRHDRRRMLIASHIIAGAAEAAIAALLLSHHYILTVIVVMSALNGCANALANPSLRGIVSDLSDPVQLLRTNAIIGGLKNGTKIIGPSLAGILVAFAGGGWAILVDAFSFLIAGMMLSRIDVHGTTQLGNKGIGSILLEGWTEFRSRSWLVAVVVMFFFVNCIQMGAWTVLGPKITIDTYGIEYWGYFVTARALGMFAASALLYRLPNIDSLIVGLLGVAVSALPLLALGSQVPAALLMVICFGGGLGLGVYSVTWETTVQRNIPKQVLSRVSSYDMLLSFAAIPIGQLSAAPLGSIFGLGGVLMWSGVFYFLIALWPLGLSSVRHAGQRAGDPS
jgi:MFS family permease